MRATWTATQSVIGALFVSCAAAFIVPEELVSFLSIVYSNIPPVRKGTDSRVGLGWRLGPHADAQVVLELGPQTNTRPLGAAGPSFGSPSSSKRHAALQPLDALALDDGGVADGVPAPYNPAAGNWLTAWRTSIAAQAARRSPTVDDDLANQADLSAPGPVSIGDPTKLSGAPLVSHLRKLYRNRKGAAHQPELQSVLPWEPKRQPERQPERTPERVEPEPWRPAPAVAPSKPYKRSKARTKSAGKANASTKKPTTTPVEDLSDVTLD